MIHPKHLKTCSNVNCVFRIFACQKTGVCTNGMCHCLRDVPEDVAKNVRVMAAMLSSSEMTGPVFE